MKRFAAHTTKGKVATHKNSFAKRKQTPAPLPRQANCEACGLLEVLNENGHCRSCEKLAHDDHGGLTARYINVTIIDEQGASTSTQIFTSNSREAFDYVESEMAARNGQGRNCPLVAAFIFDTKDNVLRHYIISGLRARLVDDKFFQ
jgi:hypothetical protein